MTLPEAPSTRLWPFLWQHIKPWRWGFVLMAVLHSAFAVEQTVFPLILKYLVDALGSFEGARAEVWQAIKSPILWGLFAWVALEICYRLQGVVGLWIMPAYRARVRMAMFSYTQGHSYQYFADHFAGSIANKISDMPRSSSDLIVLCLQVFTPLIVGAILSISMQWNQHPGFAGLSLLWFVCHMGISIGFAARCNVYSRIHSEALSDLQGRLVDSITGMHAVRLFARRAYELQHMKPFQDTEIKTHRAALWYMEKVKLALGVLSLVGFAAITWLLVVTWQREWITLGDFIFIITVNLNLMMLAWWSSLQFTQFFNELGVCRQALSLLTAPHGVRDMVDASELAVGKGEVRFDKVTFHYKRGRNIFENQSVIIPGGQKVGLVGFSGSGKSTFVNLILRHYDIESGQIRIDGQDIATVSQESLHRHIAVIPQEPVLFHRTLMENIRYGRLDATDREVIDAARQAHCHEFIQMLEEGYNATVGERGIKLSAGQRQRIAIARAVLKNAPILILDEATSALDSVTERCIQESLHNLMEGRTAIVIAHRLSTLSDMERILVFHQGHIVEDGPHDALLAKGEHYARLWRMQAGGFLPESEESA